MGERVQLTKNDMSRVIVQALFRMDKLPPADHFQVERIAKRKKDALISLHRFAVANILERQE